MSVSRLLRPRADDLGQSVGRLVGWLGSWLVGCPVDRWVFRAVRAVPKSDRCALFLFLFCFSPPVSCVLSYSYVIDCVGCIFFFFILCSCCVFLFWYLSFFVCRALVALRRENAERREPLGALVVFRPWRHTCACVDASTLDTPPPPPRGCPAFVEPLLMPPARSFSRLVGYVTILCTRESDISWCDMVSFV